MANKRAQPGDPGQAGKLDPRGPNKFEPTTKARGPAKPGEPGGDHSLPGDNKK
ncbi:hypothetical protein SEA_DIRTMONSTER_167 [Mycobacterium phage DirtMonster]|uniref:Uncharacterized protein n=39 Tax=Bixzunavirus TaxID=680114 RepID=R4TD09_9CAUD|nr:hypothetical protein ET08_161 [Mycobacterium phage ET08]YP_008060955.1 hypothetical protein M181_gp172 [Mycobacterium phage Gizmo]YP_008061646.1 hypothetical protein M182_gp164 [Mycobacterium phage Astraea]YP_009012938.1 hypothetical protein DANDELION_181 [Mycobacterium phage Dandelion]YP_009014744.1 hypothetical protein LINSTU_172 [Mycobacterium phage LinStu]YP_009016616.1 hypothetical protein NAPPY_175 [Mycobacterium phage Nappy]YP_009017487.1 hypothetical protein MOMOMIXON_172 [Mycobact